MSNTPWIRKIQILYIVTAGLWAVAFAVVVYAATQTGDWGSLTGIAIMGVGPVYFLIEGFLLARQTDDAARTAAKRLFRFQRTLGIAVAAGGIVGFLPAAANFLSVSDMALSDQLNNAGMLVPWALVYVYMVVFFVAEGIRRGLNVNEKRAARASGESATTTEDKKTSKRTPIAPNLFFVFAILLALFTAQVETTAFTMARSGELTDLQTPGMAFSFLQFIDIGAKAIALVALVLGVINFSRDSATLRRFATPLLALATVAIPPGALGVGIAGATGLSPEAQANDETAQISSDWINNVMESSQLDGFTTFSNVYDCAAENCEDPDSGFMLVREGDTVSVAADVCASVVAYAFDTGAATWAIAPDYVPVTLESGEDAAANAMCVTSLADYPELEHAYSITSAVFRLSGDGEVPFQMDLVEIDMGTADANPDAINYSLTIATTFVPDELLPGEDMLTDGTHELNDLLTAIGQARMKNADVDPNDASLIRDAIVTYPYDIPVTPLFDKDGKIRFIEITQSDENQPMCISIAPWNEEFEGMPDPGYGYGVSSADSIADLKANPHFGAQAWGHCDE